MTKKASLGSKKKGGKGGARKEKEAAEPVANLPGAEFDINEMALAYHGPMMYETKVLKQQQSSKDGKNTFSYFVHYNKWSKRWDEWVSSSRLMKKDDGNIKLMASLKKRSKGPNPFAMEEEKEEEKEGEKEEKEEKEEKKGKGGKRKSPGASPSKGSKKKKQKLVDPTVEPTAESALRKGEIKLKLPGQLKKYLVQDWENIVQEEKLVPLPRPVTVNDILTRWADARTRSPEQQRVVLEVAEGLRKFFARSLSVLLLYRFERPQYQSLVDEQERTEDEGMWLCGVYGGEHLARLFVKLPLILTHTKLLTNEMTLLQSKLTDFLKWFCRTKEFFAVDGYLATDAEYAQSVSLVEG